MRTVLLYLEFPFKIDISTRRSLQLVSPARKLFPGCASVVFVTLRASSMQQLVLFLDQMGDSFAFRFSRGRAALANEINKPQRTLMVSI